MESLRQGKVLLSEKGEAQNSNIKTRVYNNRFRLGSRVEKNVSQALPISHGIVTPCLRTRHNYMATGINFVDTNSYSAAFS